MAFLLLLALLPGISGCRAASPASPTALPIEATSLPQSAFTPSIPPSSLAVPPTDTPPTPPEGSLEAAVNSLRGLPFNEFVNASYKLLLLRSPEAVTSSGLAGDLGASQDQLNDLSEPYLLETQRLESAILDLLLAYDRSALPPEQQITYDTYAWYLDDLVRSHPFMDYSYSLSPGIESAHLVQLLFFTDIQPVASLQDARDYVARLAQVQVKFSQVVTGLERREQAGVLLPAFLIPTVLHDLREIVTSPPEETPYYTAFAEKLAPLSSITAAQRQSLLQAAAQAIQDSVIPAYQALYDTLARQQSIASNDAGVWKFPAGAEYYAYLLRHHTTTDLSVDQIHALGLEHLERIQAEMRLIFDQLGYPAGTDLSQLMSRTAQESGLLSGEQIFAAFEALLADAKQTIAPVFDLLPQADVIIVSDPIGGYYYPPALDGSRPGVFYAYSSGVQPRYVLPSLLFHETIPGHHYQIALAQELDLPLFQRDAGFTGFIEGWALYAEHLMWELGYYQDDPYGDLGRLQFEAWRAARLVVDTGLHAKKWSFDKALDFMIASVGLPRERLQGEISRYVVMPGQATAYYIGYLELLDLRQRMQVDLGAQFDLKTFHRVVLEHGAVPLSVLETLVSSALEAP